MKKHLSAAVIITLILAVASVAYSANHNQKLHKGDSIATAATTDEATKDETEMRGMWVSYISLDMNGTDYSESSFREKFGRITETAEENGCNALFVHVRAFCDAFYKSDIFPSSHVLWGQQGANENFDALSIMCEMCKKKNLEIHAWINPYRVTAKSSEFTISENNPYILTDSIAVESDGGIYLNPANYEARKLIVNGVKEILENYKVDGIHFDDYFYPTTDESFDKAEYNQYLKSFASKADAMPLYEWRKNNVNLLVAEVYRTVKEYNKDILFGISPQGNIQNDLEMGADVKSWSECIGYVDYICPQLYYSLENPALNFKAGLENWLEFQRHENLKLYAGLAVYKAGTNADEGTWSLSDDILAKELEIIRNEKLNGYILYDYEAIINDNAQSEMKNFRKFLN